MRPSGAGGEFLVRLRTVHPAGEQHRGDPRYAVQRWRRPDARGAARRPSLHRGTRPDFLGVEGERLLRRNHPRRARFAQSAPGRGNQLSAVTRSLAGGAFRGDIVLSHLHWDHVHSLRSSPRATAMTPGSGCCLPAQGDASPDRPRSAARGAPSRDVAAQLPIRPEGLRRGTGRLRGGRRRYLHRRWLRRTALAEDAAAPRKARTRRIPRRGRRHVVGITFRTTIRPSSQGRAANDGPGAECTCHGAMFAGLRRAVAHALGQYDAR